MPSQNRMLRCPASTRYSSAEANKPPRTGVSGDFCDWIARLSVIFFFLLPITAADNFALASAVRSSNQPGDASIRRDKRKFQVESKRSLSRLSDGLMYPS